MSYHLLDEKNIWFPNPELADPQGIVALGGDLRPERLLLAYRRGIFPWFSHGEPIIWWSPDPRFVLFPNDLKLRRSLRKVIRNGPFEVRFDTAFEEVISRCSVLPRPGQNGTWITLSMRQAYIHMFRLGFAHSVETWLDDRLVGGLYGLGMGPFFFGESMFHIESNASKVALAALVDRYRNAPLIDCQVHNEFFESMGATLIRRDRFLNILDQHIDEPNIWTERFDP